MAQWGKAFADKPEFNPSDPHGAKREPIAARYPLTTILHIHKYR